MNFYFRLLKVRNYVRAILTNERSDQRIFAVYMSAALCLKEKELGLRFVLKAP